MLTSSIFDHKVNLTLQPVKGWVKSEWHSSRLFIFTLLYWVKTLLLAMMRKVNLFGFAFNVESHFIIQIVQKKVVWL